MKKMMLMVLVAALSLSLFAGCGILGGGETTAPPEDLMYTFEVGISMQMPEGFQEKESKHNDFFGTGNNGTYAMIANVESKEGFTDLTEYAEGIAKANDAGEIQLSTEGGYLYIEYINPSDGNRMYTVFVEGEESFYRVAFYCPESNWSTYQSLFPVWASTITAK